MEIKRIEMELHQKIIRLIWKKIKRRSREPLEEKSRRTKLFKVIETIRNTRIQNNMNDLGTSKNTPTEEEDDHSEETTSTNSNY